MTFIKAKLKKSDNQTNIDKYRVAAISTEYHIISKLFFRKPNDKAIVSYKNICQNEPKDFLYSIHLYQESSYQFKIDRTIVTYLN